MKQILPLLRTVFGILLLCTVLLGVVYPFTVTLGAQLAFPPQAKGSLIEKDGQVIGSQLLGQSFSNPKYFWGRPSATTPPYNAAASGASNLSPANPALRKAIHERVQVLRKADPGNKAPVPVDLVTASASGLDPHISDAAAEYQVNRVARARHMRDDEVRSLVKSHMEGGALSGAYVNVLKLNLALDQK